MLLVQLILITVLAACAFSPVVLARQKFDASQLEFIDNGIIKLGVSPDLGGAITYISKSKGDENIINNWDWGRQIQMSFFLPRTLHRKGTGA